MTARTRVCLGRTLTSVLGGCVLDVRGQMAVGASWRGTQPQFSHSPKNIHMRMVGVWEERCVCVCVWVILLMQTQPTCVLVVHRLLPPLWLTSRCSCEVVLFCTTFVCVHVLRIPGRVDVLLWLGSHQGRGPKVQIRYVMVLLKPVSCFSFPAETGRADLGRSCRPCALHLQLVLVFSRSVRN